MIEPKTIEQVASDVVRKYVRYDDHTQYVAGDPGDLKRDIIAAIASVLLDTASKLPEEKPDYLVVEPSMRSAWEQGKAEGFNAAIDDCRAVIESEAKRIIGSV